MANPQSIHSNSISIQTTHQTLQSSFNPSQPGWTTLAWTIPFKRPPLVAKHGDHPNWPINRLKVSTINLSHAKPKTVGARGSPPRALTKRVPWHFVANFSSVTFFSHTNSTSVKSHASRFCGAYSICVRASKLLSSTFFFFKGLWWGIRSIAHTQVDDQHQHFIHPFREQT